MLYHYIGEFDMTDVACVGDPRLHPVDMLHESINDDTKIRIENIANGKYIACHLAIRENEAKTLFCFHSDYVLKELLTQDAEYIGLMDVSYGHIVSIGDNRKRFSEKVSYHTILEESLFYIRYARQVIDESPYDDCVKEQLRILSANNEFATGSQILDIIGEYPVWSKLRFIPNNVISLEIERNTAYSFNNSHIWKYGVASKVCCTSLPVWVYKDREQVVAIAVAIDGKPALPKLR